MKSKDVTTLIYITILFGLLFGEAIYNKPLTFDLIIVNFMLGSFVIGIAAIIAAISTRKDKQAFQASFNTFLLIAIILVGIAVSSLIFKS